MKEIEYSFTTAMSLHAYSISSSEEDEDVGSDLLEMSDDEFLKSMESELNTVKEDDESRGQDESSDSNDDVDNDVDNTMVEQHDQIDEEPGDGHEVEEEQTEANDEDQAAVGSESAEENQP
jgi:hypothetical protein